VRQQQIAAAATAAKAAEKSGKDHMHLREYSALKTDLLRDSYSG
jgi:hypothetical protein